MPFDLNLPSLGLQLGSGAVIGFVIGYAFKKVAKIIAVLVGLELALFKLLESRGYMSVRWDKLSGGLLKAGESAAGAQPPSWFMTILSTLSVSVGFAGGFFLGFKRG